MVALDCQEVASIAITYCRNGVGKGGGRPEQAADLFDGLSDVADV